MSGKDKILEVLGNNEVSPQEDGNIRLYKKEEITRQHFKSNDLKRLVIRFDYQGVTIIDDFITDIKNWFNGIYPNQFRFRKSLFNNSLHPSYDSITAIESIPRSERVAYTFYSDALPHENSRLEISISEFSMSLEWTGSQYIGFEFFRDFISTILFRLSAMEPYVEITKIGIYKTSAFFDTDPSAIRKFMELEALPNPIVVERYPSCNYTDNFLWEEKNVIVNLNRELWWGALRNGSDEEAAYQISLNYDVYRTFQNQKVEKEQVLMTLNDINDAHFILFKESVTEEYLNYHCHD